MWFMYIVHTTVYNYIKGCKKIELKSCPNICKSYHTVNFFITTLREIQGGSLIIVKIYFGPN